MRNAVRFFAALAGAALMSAVSAADLDIHAEDQINLDQEGLGGTWYDPDTSGQGLQLELHADDGRVGGNGLLFGAWYTYDVNAGGAGSQRWYSIMSALEGDMRSVVVNIYQNAGGNFAASPSTSSDYVGHGVLSFDSCESGRFDYAMNDGRTGVVPLRKLMPNIGCVESGTPSNPPSDFGFSGGWYDTATGGQGIMVDVNPASGQAFLGWYTYPERGDAGTGLRWFSGQAAYSVGSRTMELTLYNSEYGTFDSAATAVVTRPVGKATLTFVSCDTATFDYAFQTGEFEGKHGAIPLYRLDVAPASCPIAASP